MTKLHSNKELLNDKKESQPRVNSFGSVLYVALKRQELTRCPKIRNL